MRFPIISTLLFLGGWGFTTAGTATPGATATSSDDDAASISSIEYSSGDGYLAQDPMNVGAMAPESARSTARQRQEKAHLMKRMDRKHGKWGTTHPRYRLLEALFGFSKYRERNMAELDRWRSLYKNVGKKQKQNLERVVRYKKKLDDVEELIYTNEVVCKSIVATALQYYDITPKELNDHIIEAEKAGRQADRMSVAQTLKHFVRDWAEEGSKERDEAFPCILSAVSDLKAHSSESKRLRVLLPGSGVGRLGHDIANLGGFEVTINEWSMFMNVGYRFIDSQSASDAFAFHPFIDGMSHHATTSDMLRPILAPNIAPNGEVLLVEGDFNTAFNGQEGQFDVVVTHYFIDTARNLMAYFDTIHRLLPPDEIIAIVEDMGFVFEDLSDECGELTFEGKKVRSKQSEYGFNRKALTRHAYLAQAWIVRKT
ncbi:N2227-domain-containing protein [Plenodomus tracheiphilus IPT5]|uniref:N2227-domain-containing protein n=1 Tax=Plenodomus tracheiphilus IPT5 TaxID=1408161 RepID=A0A6A7B580_9PLEO|nr:N2227-domain-containing protein [Plenodomus tracheiphilus IPT5]